MNGGELTPTQIRALLHELGRRLQAAGARGDVKLVALILQRIDNRPTADIDASYADPTKRTGGQNADEHHSPA
jgi:hypothetical protein